MGNKMSENKILSEKEFNIKFIGKIKKGGNSYLIKLIKDSKKYFNIKIRSEKGFDRIIYKNGNKKFTLNLIDTNKNIENNKFIADCIILEYYINDIKSFEDVKILNNEKLKKIKETNLIYLIGIKKNYEEKTQIEAMNFALKNNLKFFSISDGNENDIKTFLII